MKKSKGVMRFPWGLSLVRRRGRRPSRRVRGLVGNQWSGIPGPKDKDPHPPGPGVSSVPPIKPTLRLETFRYGR